jgi:hypothetical protein
MVKSADFSGFLHEQGFVLVTWKELARALPADYGVRARDAYRSK